MTVLLAFGPLKSDQDFNRLGSPDDEIETVSDLEHMRGIARLVEALDGIRQLPSALPVHERKFRFPEFAAGISRSRIAAVLPDVSPLLLRLAGCPEKRPASFGSGWQSVGALAGRFLIVRPSRKNLSALASGTNSGAGSK